MKLKELLSSIYAGDKLSEVSIEDNGCLVIEDTMISNLSYDLYKSLGDRAVKSVGALGLGNFFISLTPSN